MIIHFQPLTFEQQIQFAFECLSWSKENLKRTNSYLLTLMIFHPSAKRLPKESSEMTVIAPDLSPRDMLTKPLPPIEIKNLMSIWRSVKGHSIYIRTQRMENDTNIEQILNFLASKNCPTHLTVEITGTILPEELAQIKFALYVLNNKNLQIKLDKGCHSYDSVHEEMTIYMLLKLQNEKTSGINSITPSLMCYIYDYLLPNGSAYIHNPLPRLISTFFADHSNETTEVNTKLSCQNLCETFQK